MEHPVFVLEDRTAFYRTHLYYKDEKKKVAIIPPVTTAQRAVNRKLPQRWDEPETQYPLILNRQPDVLLVDCDSCVRDGKLHPTVAELQERLPTYWDISTSGKGRHALALTNLERLRGKKKLVIPLDDDPEARIEIFVGCQPAILTNKHAALRPLANCDAEIKTWIDEIIEAPHVGGEDVCVLRHTIFPSALFIPWLTTHPHTGSFPGATKRLILQELWNAPTYNSYSQWKPFYEEGFAKQLGMTRQQMSKHIVELDVHGWLERRHKREAYGPYKTGLSIKLNVEDHFLQGGSEE